VVGSGIERAKWLVGHRRPQESSQFPGDSDVRDGRAFPAVVQVSVAVIQPYLRLPGAFVRLGVVGWAAWWVPVVPGRFDQ
jgi:hypothetical protein